VPACTERATFAPATVDHLESVAKARACTLLIPHDPSGAA
jgi:hypothetical protein